MTRLALFTVLAAVSAAGCSPRRIPGTEIRDTGENRALYDTVQAYRQAMEKRDAPGVLALVAPDYYDAAGTPDPGDDLDRAGLEQALPADLAKTEALRLELIVRRVAVQGEQAEVEVFYDGWYRVQTPAGAVPRRDSDVHRMRLRKVDGAWKFVSGL